MRDFYFFVVYFLSQPASYHIFFMIYTAPVAAVRWSQMTKQLAVKVKWVF